MAIPDFQTLMLPLLQLAGEGHELSFGEAAEHLATAFGLTDEERRELLPSGRYPRFRSRVGWARTDLSKAGLLEAIARGRFRITSRGSGVLAQDPERIDRKFLSQFPEFVAYLGRPAPGVLEHSADRQGDTSAPSIPPVSDLDHVQTVQTPYELLDATYQALRLQLAQDLLQQMKRCPPEFFERLVVDVLVSMGYGGSRKDAGQAVGQSGDGGIDGIIKEDRLGLDVVFIQAKRWEGTVGSSVVREFAGSLAGHRANKGVLITTSRFSKDAVIYVERIGMKIVLIDGEQLAQLMIEYGVGVVDVETYTIKRVDPGYFEEEL
jgi:restriction system protein